MIHTSQVVAAFVMSHLSALRRDDERGATAVEYGLMVALIAVVIIGAVQVLGQNTSSKFSQVGSAIGS
jgi:pilus assembly protein Flp/PilA